MLFNKNNKKLLAFIINERNEFQKQLDWAIENQKHPSIHHYTAKINEINKLLKEVGYKN